jgi:hypothetical protein
MACKESLEIPEFHLKSWPTACLKDRIINFRQVVKRDIPIEKDRKTQWRKKIWFSSCYNQMNKYPKKGQGNFCACAYFCPDRAIKSALHSNQNNNQNKLWSDLAGSSWPYCRHSLDLLRHQPTTCCILLCRNQWFSMVDPGNQMEQRNYHDPSGKWGCQFCRI